MTRKSTSSSENSRGASVCAVITPIARSVTADDGEREQRLELLLLELREVLRARVGESVVADERGLAALRSPPREALAALDDDLPRLPLVRRRGSAQHEPLAVVLDQVREARVHAARVGHELDDRAQHFGQLERRRHRRHDLLERLLPRLQPHSPGDRTAGSALWTNRRTLVPLTVPEQCKEGCAAICPTTPRSRPSSARARRRSRRARRARRALRARRAARPGALPPDPREPRSRGGARW